jgi:hypothetical protein
MRGERAKAAALDVLFLAMAFVAGVVIALLPLVIGIVMMSLTGSSVVGWVAGIVMVLVMLFCVFYFDQ